MTGRPDDPGHHAAALLAEHRYAEARELYEGALADGDDPEALSGLAAACRALDDIPSAVAALERAYLRYLADDRPADAAVAACTRADVELTHLGAAAVASGWLSRARHHLRSLPDDPAHVLLEGQSAYLALAYDKDPEVAREHAERALAHAQRLGDATAEIVGQAYLGLIDVSLGRLETGMARLDGATAAASAGELSPLDSLDTYCLLLTACERVRDVDRVDQWARRVLDLATEAGSDGFATFARTQYAAALIWRGRWPEAEDELARVLRDAAQRPMTAALGMVLRARLRRRQGRLDEARAELAAAEVEPYRRGVRHLVLAIQAELELAHGEPRAAIDLAERYLRTVSPSDRIERIDTLETLAGARLALGLVDEAAVTADELDATAELVPTDGVRGAALATRAAVERGRGDPDAAAGLFEEAVARFDTAGLPYEAADTRVRLAECLVEVGRPDAARREASAGRATAAELGAAAIVAAAETVLAALRDETPPAAGLTPREVEVLRLMAEGRSNDDIAQELVLSVRTVERHVSNIYLKVGATGPTARTIAVAFGRRHGVC